MRVPRKRAIWVNIPFGGVNFSEVAGEQLLLLPEDWEASFTDSPTSELFCEPLSGRSALRRPSPALPATICSGDSTCPGSVPRHPSSPRRACPR